MKHRHILLTVLLLSFFLGLHDGCLALWKKGEEAPVRTFPYHAVIFTARDRQLLRQGIPFSSETELTGLLEDYMS